MDESEGLFRTIFDAAPDGVLVVDADGIIVESNPAVGRLLGYDDGDLVGRAVETLIPKAARDRHLEHRERYRLELRPRPMGLGLPLRARHRDGRAIPVEISLSPMETDAGPLVIAAIRDMRERIRLQRFGAEALRASEEERHRIARELHDDTAQHLASLIVRLGLAERDGQRSDWRSIIEETREELKSCAEGVRRIARGLRPPALEDAGVVAAIRAHVRAAFSESPIEVDIEGVSAADDLTADEKLVIYRVVQEAVSNVVRHSGAARLTVRVRGADDWIEAEVTDDGCGFDSDTVQSSEEGGLGLVGMKERAAMVGGRITIESRPGQGTVVRLRIPTGAENEVPSV